MTEKINVVCPACGATNRFPAEAGGKTVVCGRCKSLLPMPGRVLEPSADQLTVLIQKSALPLLIDFYSETCVPCRMMHPIVESLAARQAGDLTVARVNTSALPGDGPGVPDRGRPDFHHDKKRKSNGDGRWGR